MTPELHGLAGAYALEALDDTERRMFAEHLADCETCAAEVASYRATAAELSQLSTTPPPPQLRADVLAGIKQVRPLPPITDSVVALRRARNGRTLWQGLAAACALIALMLGVWGVQQHRTPGRTQAGAVEQILHASDAAAVSGDVGAGHATLVYSKSRNQIALVGHSLPELPQGKTYQLWMLSDQGGRTKATSAGTFVPDPSGDATVIAAGNLAGTQAMGVSIEPAGGSPQPTDVIATMRI